MNVNCHNVKCRDRLDTQYKIASATTEFRYSSAHVGRVQTNDSTAFHPGYNTAMARHVAIVTAMVCLAAMSIPDHVDGSCKCCNISRTKPIAYNLRSTTCFYDSPHSHNNHFVRI